MGKCWMITGGVSWVVMVVFAICLWVTVDFSYIDTKFHSHKATCTLLNCTILRATCTRYSCSGTTSNRVCVNIPYTCYRRKVTLELNITEHSGGVEPGVYIGDDSTTHDNEPSTCVDFENGIDRVSCYYDDRKIASSLTMSSSRFLKWPIVGVCIMSVATFIVFIVTIVFTTLCCMEMRDECTCYWIDDCRDAVKDKFRKKVKAEVPMETPTETPTGTPDIKVTIHDNYLDTPGGDSENL